MSHESFPSPESNKVEKEQVINAYKKFIEQGITSPDDLDLDDPEVIEANNLFFKWIQEGDAAVKGDTAAEQRFNSEKTFFYLDAGFTDATYAEEILMDLAEQDLQEVAEVIETEEGEEPNENANPEIAEEIRKKIAFYKEKLLPGME